jgi:hypothetical protein
VVERTLASVEDEGARLLQRTTLQQLCDAAEVSPKPAGAGELPQA